MPVYEYECESCGAVFDRFVHSAAEADSAECPRCGARRSRRRLSVFAARSGTNPDRPSVPVCARCGDPNGPCVRP